jgi:hypothetical protein
MFLPGNRADPLSPRKKKEEVQKVVYPKYCIRYAITQKHICKVGKSTYRERNPKKVPCSPVIR